MKPLLEGLLSPFEPEAFDAEAAEHLLTRVEFGATPERIAEAHRLGLEETVAQLLEAATAPFDDSAQTDLISLGRLDLAQAWWLERLAGEGGCSALRERLALIWHGLFATSQAKVQDFALMLRQNSTQRELALAPFPQLLRAMLVDPAMLVWLDGDQNRVGQPNENLARELFELFALGIGNYTERDVLEAARALSGWTVSGRAARHRQRWFDDQPKTIFDETRNFDVDSLVDATTSQTACARFIAGRLAREFVHPAPDPNRVEALADLLRATQWDLERCLGQLLRSEWFFSPSNRRARIASPVEWSSRARRQLGGGPAPLARAEATSRMGQDLLQPPSVKGWDGHRAWIGAASWIERERAALRWARDPATSLVFADVGRADLPDAVFARLLPARPRPDWAAPLQRDLESMSREEALRTLVAATLCSPEYQLI